MKTALIFCLLFPGISIADTFKCVDQGRTVYSSKPCGDSAVMISNLPPDVEKPREVHSALSSVRKITLVKDRAGMFRGRGKFGVVPVVFLVDTGATITSISERIACAADNCNCVSYGIARTANGQTVACYVFSDIEFGGLVIKKHRVDVLKNMDDEMLIGQDILQQLKVEQHKGVMVLSVE